MKKCKLSREEMIDRFHNHFSWEIGLTLFGGFLAGPSVGIVVAFSILNVSTVWQVVGWTLIAIVIGCLMAAVGFSVRGSYWANKVYGPSEVPKWFAKTNAKWRTTHER